MKLKTTMSLFEVDFEVFLPTAPENFYAYLRLRIAHSVHQVQILIYCIKKFFMTNEFQDITIKKNDNEGTSNTVGYSCLMFIF